MPPIFGFYCTSKYTAAVVPEKASLVLTVPWYLKHYTLSPLKTNPAPKRHDDANNSETTRQIIRNLAAPQISSDENLLQLILPKLLSRYQVLDFSRG